MHSKACFRGFFVDITMYIVSVTSATVEESGVGKLHLVYALVGRSWLSHPSVHLTAVLVNSLKFSSLLFCGQVLCRVPVSDQGSPAILTLDTFAVIL
jgi:hypothetical protein